MSETKRVLIIGYYGERNAGDEAILTAMLDGLRRRRPGLQFTVPTYGPDPAEVERSYGVQSFPMHDTDRLFAAVDEADLILLGGGGVLHDLWRPNLETLFTPRHAGLTYYCGIPWLGAQLGKPVMLYAVGVGPLLFEESRELVRDVATAAQAITVRDPLSAELLRGLGVHRPSVEMTADAAWQLRASAQPGSGAMLPLTGGPNGWVGVAVRNWDVGVDQAKWEQALLDGLAAFARTHGLGLAFVPFQERGVGLQDDLGLARRLASQFERIPTAVIAHAGRVSEILNVFSECELIVGMRLHATIFACIVGKPVLAIAYDPKVAVHAAMLEPPLPCIELSSLTEQTLSSSLSGLWEARAWWIPLQRQLAGHMRHRAQRNVMLAVRLLEQPGRFAGRPRRRVVDFLQEGRRVRNAVADGRLDRLRDDGIPAPEGIQGVQLATRGHDVQFIVPQFLDRAGEITIFGGSERYLVELCRLIRTLGHPVTVFQPAGGPPWERSYQHLRIVGVDVNDYFELEQAVRSRTALPALTIHLAFYTAGPSTVPPAIGISHGVYWDDPYYHEDHDRAQWHQARVLSALEHLDLVVSVDTNTIGWVSATSPRLASKLTYVPNFVDLRAFMPRPRKASTRRGRIAILFPRRLVTPRGFWLMETLVPAVLEAHQQVEFQFVGQAAGEEEVAIRRLMAAYPGRVRWGFLPHHRMPSAYQGTDIAVLPTLSSEGTALACLEAQACGVPVVATRVGGLPNLILDDYNGILVEPNAAAVRAGLERLIRDPGLRHRLAGNALKTVQAFAIDRWRNHWLDILRTFLPDRPSQSRRLREDTTPVPAIRRLP